MVVTSLATLRLPASEFALERTLAEFPDVSVRFLRSASVGGSTSTPLLWVRGDGLDGFGDALARDPSVASVTDLAGSETTRLYGLQWPANRSGERSGLGGGESLLRVPDVVLLDGVGRSAEWTFRALAQDRCGLGSVTDEWTDGGVAHSVERVTTLDDVPSPDRFGLTGAQHEALATAYRHGYYDVPRRGDIERVAGELGVSHQAASERLRRGHGRLVENALLCQTEPTLPL